WRALAAIAYHDRFNKNLRGCYAKHRTLAAEIGVHEKTMVALAKDLVAWGYLTAEPNELDRRLVVYRVIYDDPKSVTSDITDFDPETCEVRGPIGNVKAADGAKIGNVENRESETIQPLPNPIRESSKERDGVETQKRYRQTASLKNFEEASGMEKSVA